MRGEPYLGEYKDRSGKRISDNWYIFYYDGKRSRRITTGYRIGTQDHEASLFLAAFILERDRPTRKPDELMTALALQDYYKEHAQYLASSVQAEYSEKKLKEHFTGFVSQITQGRVNEYVRLSQEHGFSNGTIRRDLEHLRAALNHEEREGRLLYVPKFKLPPPPTPRDRILSIEEIHTLLAHIKTDHVRNFAILMLDTGQRPGAIENLTWFQVDFEQRIIHFDKDGRRQTNKKKRPVPMSDEVYRLLSRLYKQRKTEYVLEYKEEHAGCVRKAFERAVEKAKLKDVTRYTLRHTFANLLDDLETDDKTTGDLMGHTQTKTTRHHYIKTKMAKLRLAVNQVSKVRKKCANNKKRRK